MTTVLIPVTTMAPKLMIMPAVDITVPLAIKKSWCKLPLVNLVAA
jgi:hypothetical protein